MDDQAASNSDLEQAEARLPRWMAVLAAAATLMILAAGRPRPALGFVLGATLAILNYYWLHQAIDTVFRGSSARVPKRVLLKFLLRYPLALAGIYLVYRTEWLPLAAVFGGLFVPVGGVLMEAAVQIAQGFRVSTTCEANHHAPRQQR
jgi:hypothetical protein